MFFILDKIDGGYRVISHHDELTQDTIDKYSHKERFGFFNLTQFKQNRWVELWMESENRVIVVFNDLIEHPTHAKYATRHISIIEENINLEKSIREYKPIIRNKKLTDLGI